MLLNNNRSTARQAHGYIYEDYIVDKYSLRRNSFDTEKWDAYTLDNVPVSIKTKRLNQSVELGDYFRNANIQEDFYLNVGYWKDVSHKEDIVKEIRLFIPADFWSTNFNDKTISLARDLLTGVSHDREYDSIWKQRCRQFKKDYKSCFEDSPLIIMNPKRDHKKQLRMQCSINNRNMQKLYEMFGVEDIG